MGRIRVSGERDGRRERVGPEELGALGELGGRAKNVQAARLDATARAGATPFALEGLKPDTIVELIFEDGVRSWSRYDQLADDLSAGRVAAARGRGAAGTAPPPDTIVLPANLAGPPAALRGGNVAAAATATVEAVRSFDLDLPDVLDLPGLLGGAAGTAAGPVLARRFDGLMMPEERRGLRRWTGSGPNGLVAPDGVHRGGEPLLLFIHGTASSTEGSFGALRQEAPAEPGRGEVWGTLARAYNERILALEHATLSESPLDNAIALLKALPGGARLHLVTHSRGGMVGELLCRAQRADGGRRYEEEREALQRWGERRRVDYGPDLEKLDELEKLLVDSKPRVERFVRVACPAAGTTLASGRLDRWLSLLTNLLDLTGLGASATYRCFKGFLLAAVKTRTDPRAVPGLEAMVPGSMLTALLNRPGVRTEADLSVIAGYAEGGGPLKRLAFWFSDCFYGGNHDLVVDTPAMYGGLARGQGGARVFCDYGPKVNHFGYFKNRSSALPLVAALRGEGRDAYFKALSRPPKIDKMVYGRRDGAPRPRAFVLPGLMGSHLDSGAERVWIDLPALADRRFRGLALDGAAVKAEALVEDGYGGLVEHLSGSHEVLPFPYDWRRSLRHEGERFADALAARLAEAGTPVRILAHSSGGLLALAAFGLRPKLWRDFTERDGCRLLMLGTPCRGSFAVPRLLLGEERLTAYLSLLELDADEAGLLDLLAAFPGLLELLPAPDGIAGAEADTAPDFFAPATWERLRASAARPGGGGAGPAAAALAAARETRRSLDGVLDGVRTDPERVLYVAGAAPATPVAVEADGAERGGARFLANACGDGRTAWATGAPPGARVWWAEAEHGALADHRPAFPAYAELLETGTTSLLPNAPPTVTAGATGTVPISPTLFELPPERPPIFPDEAELAAAALGFHRRPPLPARPKARVRVVHGNLGFARWPVAVGHYEGDPVLGSEGHLDRVLDHRLTKRRDLQIYPGPIGTAEILIDSKARPPGALVVGMGQVGELTPGTLRHSLAQALRRYALLARESGFAAAGEAGVTCLPIGAGEGGIGLRESVGALLDAVAQVNRTVGRDHFLAEVELVELYEDRAIQTAHAIAAALREERLRGCFEFDGSVQTGVGGRRRAFAAEDPSWWRRLKIDTDAQGRLRFNDLTDRASAPVQVLPDRRKLAERFVRGVAAGRTAPDRSDDPGATLFQLLLPTRLKESTRGDRNLLLVLDETTAGYPWEILHEGSGDGAEPPAVRAGLLRKLARSLSPDAPLLATGDTALVIGDPPSGSDEFPPLDEAKNEAEQVARLLEERRFNGADRPLIRPDADSVIRALMAERWRVLHLAGHGRFDVHPGRRAPVAGMVLSDGLLLTPDTIGGMRAAPEFVFINCCHGGRMDEKAERRAERDLPGLAANLASGFIALGARAVVAAGWAVEDAAARVFAETLYGELLRGEALGMAVRAARRKVYEDHRRTNTWGAYQCYGEPDYRLVRRRWAPGTAPAAGAKAATAPVRRFAHPREALVEIENVTQDAQTMAVRDPAALGKRLQAAWDAVPKDWRGRSDVRASVGEACAELLLLDQAIGHYRAVLATEKATAPVRVIEQLANLRARRAAVALARGGAEDRQAAEREIARAIDMVKALIKLGAGACTVERMSLLGSCYKRLAQVSGGEARTAALRRMGTCYRAAWRRTRKTGGAGTYPLLNWLLAETLRGMRDPRRPAPADLERRLADAEAEAARADAAEPEFWNAVARADAMLGRYLAGDGGINDPERQDAVVEAYLGPWRRGASPLKFASVLEQLDFVADALDDAGAEPPRPRSAALRAVAERLRAATGAPRDGSVALAVKTLDEGGGRQGGQPATGAAGAKARRSAHTAE